ncbi:uncharacterized protein EI90DRAFT_3121107 [Cantharellus anzutake]|uniref:uncharacterized protein n=1 Tax=Cantharellus anzutake TaxID=1750568 RepID=UPI0019050622|nr:uncharacterized protein EI90DRAFT_3121107 [Cantharellus anzutake]KAF8334660.1 hypothetical protein EI90DRAFT_3121107 [Cantharellus anzutake]
MTPYEQLWGSYLIGGVCSAVYVGLTLSLLGILTVQTFHYFSAFRGDPLGTRVTVVVLATVFSDWFLRLCFASRAYGELIGRFDGASTITTNSSQEAIFQLSAVSLLRRTTAVLSGPISDLGYNRSDCSALFFGPASQVVWKYLLDRYIDCGLDVSVRMTMHTHDMEALITGIEPLTTTWLGSEALLDVVIAALMCAELRKRQTGVQHTDAIVKTLMLYAINTGILTSWVLFDPPSIPFYREIDSHRLVALTSLSLVDFFHSCGDMTLTITPVLHFQASVGLLWFLSAGSRPVFYFTPHESPVTDSPAEKNGASSGSSNFNSPHPDTSTGMWKLLSLTLIDVI